MASSKVFIVTGASKGIGAAITKRLLEQSHKVVLAARSRELLEAVKTSHPGQVEYVVGDMTDSSIPGNIVSTAIHCFGRIDGLVINHGVLGLSKLADVSLEDFKRTYDINVFSCLAIAQAALPDLRKTKGSIVWVSSGASKKAYAGWSAYGSSKSAVDAISSHIAVEEADVTSIAIAPGRVDTDMQGALRAQGKDTMNQTQYATFVDAFNQGTLLRPEQPGNVIAAVVAKPPRELSGKSINWNSEELAAYQQ